MFHAIGQSDAAQRPACFGFVRGAVKILRQHHIFDRRQVGDQVKLLKDEPDFLGAESCQPAFIQSRHVHAIDQRATRGRRIQPSQNVDQRGLARARRAHDRNPLAGLHVERNTVQRAHPAEFLAQIFDLDERCHYSPRKITAGFTFPSLCNGSAPAIATTTINTIVSGKISHRGAIDVPNTRRPIHPASTTPATQPITPPAAPSTPSSARNNPTMRPIVPPSAFINPTSARRSGASAAIVASTHSAVSARISTIIESISNLVRPNRFPSASVTARTGRTSH